ncbi:hypothetical protein [Sporosarcina gallistercoris]|uniref:M50 family peptidase n=1 Tax=Sporosarcina gallistercoris TaxID=2762245 RepID=A0ABR8PLQ2_9BACL|nr:hypothetical protein [Sporosarcina gallistercoris]MBD7909091.1 hypothetical protein [Sporosarcina gallistercoris]
MNTITRTMLATAGLLTVGACINWEKSELFAGVLFTGLGILIAISLHEAGHVVGGVIAKSKLMFYSAGVIAVQRTEQGNLRVTWPENWTQVSGYVQIEHDEQRLEKSILYTVLAGPLASLLVSSLYFSNLFLFQVIGTTSFLLFVVTSLPYQLNGFFSDGYTVLQVAKNNTVFTNYYRMTNKLLAKSHPSTWDKTLQSKASSVSASKLSTPELAIYLMYLFYSAIETDNTYYLKKFYQSIDIHSLKANHKSVLAGVYHYYIATQYFLGEPITISKNEMDELPVIDPLSSARTNALLSGTPMVNETYMQYVKTIKKDSHSFLEAEKRFFEHFVVNERNRLL